MDMKIDRHATERSTQHILTYGTLTFEESRIFWKSGLYHYLQIAFKLLKAKISSVPGDGFQSPLLSAEQLAIIEPLVNALLNMINRGNDHHFRKIKTKENAHLKSWEIVEIHKSFLHPENAVSLPSLFYLARLKNKRTTLQKSPQVRVKTLQTRLQSDKYPIYSKKVFSNIVGEKKVKFTDLNLTEGEIRGVAVFYMLELIWQNIRALCDNPPSCSDQMAQSFNLVLRLPDLLSDSVFILDNSIGGKKSHKITPDMLNFISSQVKANPNCPTKTIAKRTLDYIKSNYVEDIDHPALKTLEDNVRTAKKLYRK